MVSSLTGNEGERNPEKGFTISLEIRKLFAEKLVKLFTPGQELPDPFTSILAERPLEARSLRLEVMTPPSILSAPPQAHGIRRPGVGVQGSREGRTDAQI